MKKIMNLQLFAGGHSVTVLKDAHMTTASASSTSDVQAEATVTLTLTPATNYELDTVEVLAGGVTSSLLLRELLTERNEKRRAGLRLFFGRPEFSGDNAVGVALIGLKQLQKEGFHGDSDGR